MQKTTFLILVLLLLPFSGLGEEKLLDKIDAIIGDKIILRSDIENQLDLLNMRGKDVEQNRCTLMQQLILTRMLANQAIRDSLPISDEEVEDELNRKVNYFISMAGSQEAFEAYYKKSVQQIKDDYREDIRENMLSSRMRGKITENIKITPAEVKQYFEEMSKDSLPYFNATMEIKQIVMKPKVSDLQKELALKKTKELLERLKKGESFDLLASLYSEDIASAQQGGLLDWVPRGTFVKEFEAAAFKLKDGEISDIVETPFGYHIIQMVERRGDMIQVKHILIRPKSTSADIEYARLKLDSVRNDILAEKITFEKAVKEYSSDDASKNVGGFILNNENGSTLLDVTKMDNELYLLVDTLKENAITFASLFNDNDGTPAYRIVKLISKTNPHEASLQVDYDKIQNAARASKEEEEILKWFDKYLKKTYIMVDDEYKSCDVLQSILNN